MEIYGRKRKSIAGQVIGIIICFVLFIAALAIGVLGLMSQKDGEMPSVKGYSLYTANMHVDGIPNHAAVVVYRNTMPEAKSVVLFKTTGEAKVMSVAYMMRETENGIVISDSDATAEYEVKTADIRGTVLYVVPVVGSLLNVAQSVYGGLLFVLLAFFLLLLVIMFCFKIGDRRKRHADDDDIDAVLEGIGAEAEASEEAAPASELVFTDDLVPDKKEEPAYTGMVAAASGNIDDNYISLIVNASEEEIEKVKTIIESGLGKKATDEWEVKRVEAQQPTLAIRCSWQDLAVVSLLINAIKKTR